MPRTGDSPSQCRADGCSGTLVGVGSDSAPDKTKFGPFPPEAYTHVCQVCNRAYIYEDGELQTKPLVQRGAR